MDPNADSRIVRDIQYPKIVYLEALLIFLGANFIYHQKVFRANNNRYQFLGFMLVNLFTSFQLAEACNINVARYNAAIYNNTHEMRHRATLNQQLRLKLFGQR